MSAYSSAKFALEAFSDALRREVSRFGVCVVIIEPFFYATQIMADLPRLVREAMAKASPAAKLRYGTKIEINIHAKIAFYFKFNISC